MLILTNVPSSKTILKSFAFKMQTLFLWDQK